MSKVLSLQGPDCHEAAVQWEGNFTRHAAQNPKAKTIEDTGVSESSELLVSVLRHSEMHFAKPLRRFRCGVFIKENVICFPALKYSQFDSHMDGTLDHVFDFSKVALFTHTLIIPHILKDFLCTAYHCCSYLRDLNNHKCYTLPCNSSHIVIATDMNNTFKYVNCLGKVGFDTPTRFAWKSTTYDNITV